MNILYVIIGFLVLLLWYCFHFNEIENIYVSESNIPCNVNVTTVKNYVLLENEIEKLTEILRAKRIERDH